MSQSITGGVTTNYQYNALGQRVQKSSPSETTHFIYGLNGELLAEYSEDGFIGREYVYLNGVILAASYIDNSPPQQHQFTTSIFNGSDDAEEYVAGEVRRGKGRVNLVDRNGHLQTVAFRFRDLPIPQGAQIDSAEIQFTANKGNTGSSSLDIRAEDIGQSPWISTAPFGLSGRTVTTASVNWSPPAWSIEDSGPAQLTPDLSGVVQEVVDRTDWESGNELTFIVTGDGRRRAYSFNSDPLKAAVLDITYTTAGSGDTLYYYHNDHLGTPQAMTDDAQSVVWQANYQPFGETSITASTIENNLRFPGQYFDEESGLHYNYFRDYDPGIGRYMQSDPIGLRGGINTYAYVGSNPLKWIDLYGLEVMLCTAPANILGGLVDHHWIKTDTVEAGMGAGPQPGDEYESPYVTDVEVTDHSGDSENRPGTQCRTVQNVDENRVNELLKIGKDLGKFAPPFNTCQTFAAGVLNQASTVQTLAPTAP